VFDDCILAIATVLAASGVGWLIADEMSSARAAGRRVSADLGWTLVWALGLSALFAAAWASRP
jgi:hypothetical protein